MSYNSKEIGKICEFLTHTFLFGGLNAEQVFQLIENASVEIKAFSANDVIYSPSAFESKVGFVMQGECSVERHRADGVPIPLNTLSKYEPFGILSLFSCEEKFPTFVRAKKNTQVLFIGSNDVISAVKASSCVAMNVIHFLGGRIVFLNEKISTFSSDNIEQKLAKTILHEAKRQSLNSFPFNLKRTSESLNAGRASIYRAIDVLSEKGLIKYENKKIYITDLEGLKRISK